MVYKAKCRKTGDSVALKKIRIDESEEGIPSTALREISFLRSLDHPNIVNLINVQHTISPQRLYLVFEWLECDLKHFLDTRKKMKKKLHPEEVQEIMHQLLLGLEFCHMRGLFHRDLKPQNILVTEDKKVKIADFGLARAFSVPLRSYTHEVVTLWYRAPEVLLGEEYYGLPIDMWSMGTIFAEIIRTRPLFPGDCEIDELFKMFQVLGTPNEKVWEGVTDLRDFNESFPNWPKKGVASKVKASDSAIDLIEKMLTFNPRQRISCTKAIEHRYFDEDFSS